MKAAKSQTMLPVAGTDMLLPVTELTGAKEGETITLSAGVHSREYAGVQALIELAQELDPRKVRGKIRLLHCCNYTGFLRRSADVVPQDGKNLNREFPGDPGGTPTQRLAAFLEQEFIERTDYLVDLHSGGFCESLTPHLYFHGTAAPEVRAVSRQMAELTTVPYLVESSAENGFYSWAGQRGVPAILLERGGCGLVEPAAIEGHKGTPCDCSGAWVSWRTVNRCPRRPTKSSPPPFMRTPRSPAAGTPQKRLGISSGRVRYWGRSGIYLAGCCAGSLPR